MHTTSLKAYYAALKPERTYANVMTTLAGFLFASRWHGHWLLLVYTLLGTTLIVMSACAVNNVTDRRIDARMPRTKKRATVTGEVSARRLGFIAVIFGLVGFAILAVHVNWLTTLLGAIAYIDYVVLYGWSKRTTPWSTLIGTISGAVPLVAGYTALVNQFDATAVLLGLVMIFWQMVHFYAIAIFRRKDYAAADIPVWSVRHSVKSTQQWMLGFAELYLLAVLLFGILSVESWTFVIVIGGLGLFWVYKGFTGLKMADAEKWARSMFGFSLINLLVLSAFVALAPLLP